MVNLDKWEEIEHKDVKVGDDLKIIWTNETPTLTTREIHKGIVSNFDSDGDFWLNGTCWEDEKCDVGEHTIIYRRKAKPFVFPTKRMTIIKGQRIGHDDVFINFVKMDVWYRQSGAIYTEETIRKYFHNFEIIFEGIDD